MRKKSLNAYSNYALCVEWMKQAYSRHKNRIDITETRERLMYQFFYDGELYPFYVLATHTEHGQLVQLTRHTEKMDDGRTGYVYNSQLGTPKRINDKIVILFDEPELYTVFAC